jgi:hypothetical protein
MKFDKNIVEKIKNAGTVLEEGGMGETGYVSLDNTRYSSNVIRPVVEYMTGNKVRYPGDLALGVKSISEFYKKLNEVSQTKEEKKDYDLKLPGKPEKLFKDFD